MLPVIQRRESPFRMTNLRPRWRLRARISGGLLGAAPWIDVALIGLIFFMVHSANIVRPGIEVSLPVADARGGATYRAKVLTVVHDGQLFFDDERVAPGQLRDVLAAAVERDPLLEVVLEADRSLSHQQVMGIYEAAMEAGVRKVVIATRQRPPPVMIP
ncbi:MAG TPA: biopolymer transporter ExbD [Kiritimatiellia bacterium]|nr:biopolymer transporter ExbD [Kiritimatiellia bacterium]